MNKNWAHQALLRDIVENFRQSRQIIRKKQFRKFFQKDKRPWILLMGPAQSGKTTLVANTGFSFEFPKKLSLETISPSLTIDWWVTQQAVFIDPPGKYTVASKEEPAEQALWASLLQLLKRYRKQAPLRSILLIVDVLTLAQTNVPVFNEWIDNLIQQIQILKGLNQRIPITVAISHCDRLLGFNEFFSDLSPSEREQSFGFRLASDYQNVHQEIEKQWDQLMKNLHHSLVWRLHHQQSLQKRNLIKEFPIAMEHLGQRLTTLLEQLPWNLQVFLHGVYFISSQQTVLPVDLLFPPTSQQVFGLHSTALPTVLPQASILQNKPFFIKGFIQEILEQANLEAKISKPPQWRLALAYSIAILLIVSITVIWQQGYVSHIRLFHQLTSQLNSHTHPHSTLAATVPWLASLNQLQNVTTAIQQNSSRSYQWVGLTQAKHLGKTSQQQYSTLLQATLLPFLAETLTNIIEESIPTEDPRELSVGAAVELYNALKIYLMFANPQHFNGANIQQFFAQRWKKEFATEPVVQKQLAEHLKQLLQLSHFTWPTNELLIDQARQNLAQLPLAKWAFILLQDSNFSHPIPILPSTLPLQGIDISQAQVPAFCHSAHFEEVYHEKIPALVQEIQKENWVASFKKQKPFTSSEKAKLIAEVQQIYRDYYSQQWATTLAAIHLNQPSTLSQALYAIHLLTDNQSPLWKIFKLVEDNVHLNQPLAESQLTLSPATLLALNQLSQSLSLIRQSPDPDKASFQAAALRLTNASNTTDDPITAVLQNANNAPPLVRLLVMPIAKGSWRILLDHSRQFINSIWETTIIPQYHQYIDQRYPLVKGATEDISLNSFITFFGPNGAIEQFFNQYLKPFINMENDYWTWKKLDEEAIAIPQETLEMFIRASLIQQMFFMDNRQTLHLGFILQPKQLAETTRSLILHLGTQVVVFSQNEQTNSSLEWPPRDHAPSIDLQLQGMDDKAISLTLLGPWAWLKLLDQALVKPTLNAQDFEVTFQFGKYAATYDLTANQAINPYIPGILYKFHCPERL